MCRRYLLSAYADLRELSDNKFFVFFFFFSSRRRHTRCLSDWSSDVCSSDLFPLGIGPDPALLRTIAPGVIWVAALLASMLALQRMFASDHSDGTLEQMLLGEIGRASCRERV